MLIRSFAFKGNMETVFGSGNGNLSEIVENPDFSNPGIAFDDVIHRVHEVREARDALAVAHALETRESGTC